MTSVLRLRRFDLDEARRRLQELQLMRAGFERELTTLEQSVENEAAAAAADREAGTGFPAWLAECRQRRSHLLESLRRIDTEIDVARSALSEAYREVKSLEQAIENQERRNRKIREHRARAELDEISLDLYRRSRPAA